MQRGAATYHSAAWMGGALEDGCPHHPTERNYNPFPSSLNRTANKL